MVRFWLEKIGLLVIFMWWREWWLVKEEWNLTYRQMEEARGRADELNTYAAQRLLAREEDDIGP